MSVEIITGLKDMKLNGMASGYPALVAKSGHSKFEPDTFIKQLIGAETAERTVRAMAYQMGAARLLMHRDLAGFDFTASQVDEALIGELHQGKFIAAAQNLVLIGGPAPARRIWPPSSATSHGASVTARCGRIRDANQTLTRKESSNRDNRLIHTGIDRLCHANVAQSEMETRPS